MAILSALGQNARKIRAKSYWSSLLLTEREKGSLIEMGGVEGKVVVVYGNKRQGEKREEAQTQPPPPKKKIKNTHDRPKTIGNWNRQMMRNEERNKSRR